MDLKNLSSNWKKLQASGTIARKQDTKSAPKAKVGKPQRQDGNLKRGRDETARPGRTINGAPPAKRPRTMSKSQTSEGLQDVEHSEVEGEATDGTVGAAHVSTNPGDRINEGLATDVEVGKYLALDCEMVGVGPHPDLESALARVSLVNYDGLQVYDSYVRPREEVTDWRTHVSGIRPRDMAQARSFEDVQRDVAALIKGRIVVGHAVRKDFEALFLDHPKRDVRDTARHAPYRKLAGGGSPKLKVLASELLGLHIQGGEHSSVEDARATILLFRRDKDSFEREHIKKWGVPVTNKWQKKAEGNADAGIDVEVATKKSKKKKKKRK